MALPVHSNHQPAPRDAPGATSRTPRASGACRQRPSPRHPARAVLTAATDAHGPRRRAVLARCAVVAVGVAVFVAATEAAALVGPHLGPASPGGRPATEQPVALRLVQPGETLWSIAVGLGLRGDLRATVDRLARLNGGAAIRAGQTLRVPLEWMTTQP